MIFSLSYGRPWILLCRERQLRRVYQAIFSTWPTLLKMFGVVTAYVWFFTAIGLHVFAEDYNNSQYTFLNGRDSNDFTGAFDSIVWPLPFVFS